MKPVRRFLARLWALFSRKDGDDRLKQEIEDHLALQTAENIRAGMSSEEARRQAVLKFGGVESVREEYRSERALPVVAALVRDVRYAIRQIRGAPAFALAAILALTLGIGANTTIFSVLNAVILRPLPFPHPDRLLSVRSLYTRGQPRPDEMSYPNFFDFRALNRVFTHLVSLHDSEFSLQTAGRPLHLDGEIVSWDLFPALGVSPIHGRGFMPQEEKPGVNVTVISYNLWQSQFHGNPGIVGGALTIDGKAFTVVGIAPKSFHFPVDHPDVQLWTTIAQDAIAPAGLDPITVQRGARLIDAIGRLKPGITIDQARAQMDAIAADLARQDPDNNKNVARTAIRPELEEVIGVTREPLLIVMGAVGLLLLIACLNVANLLLSRTTERAREFALRSAIGASRMVILRQILTEGLTLALLGTLGGVLFALVSVPLLVHLAGAAVPRLENARIDSFVLVFCTALAVFTAVLFSLAPMTQIARAELIEFVKEGTRGISGGRNRLRSALVVAQLTLGLVLLSGAVLLAATFVKLENRDPGFKPDQLLKFSIDLPEVQYPIAKQILFDDRLIERLQAIPGVESVACGWPLPFEGDQVQVAFDIQERPAPPSERPHADLAIVTPDFFRTLGIPLLRGRGFTQRDDTSAPAVIMVNQAFADRFFPGEDALGKRIQSGATNGSKGPAVETIVGVVANARQSALTPGPDPIYYFPYKQLSWQFGWTLVRTSIPPRNLESAVRAAVAGLDPQLPVYNVTTMQDAFSVAMAPPRFLTSLLGSFAAIALLLTTVGVYGLMMYSVSKRTGEIGVRLALGANRGSILRMVFGETAILLIIGIALGVVAANFTDGLLTRIPFVVHFDSWILLSAAGAGMIVAGAIATLLPARRAASIDPVRALRVE